MFPYHAQETNYTCGAASMRMILDYFGIKKSEKQIARILHTNKVRGTWPRYIPRLAEKYNFDYVVLRNATFKDIRRLLREKYLVVIIYSNKTEGDHYSVIKQLGTKYIHFWDPDPDWGPETAVPRDSFWRLWKTDHEFSRPQKRWLCAVKKP